MDKSFTTRSITNLENRKGELLFHAKIVSSNNGLDWFQGQKLKKNITSE